MADELGRAGKLPYASASRRAFYAWDRFARSPRGIAVLFAWATAESTVWPVIPDFLLLPVVVAQRRRPHIPLLATVAGSSIGSVMWYSWAAVAPDKALTTLRRIPFVRSDHIDQVHTRIACGGTRALFGQPWSGIGLKVWAPLAAVHHIPARRALPVFFVARALRMGMVAAVTAMLSKALIRWIEALALPLTAGYLVAFSGLWWRVTMRQTEVEDR